MAYIYLDYRGYTYFAFTLLLLLLHAIAQLARQRPKNAATYGLLFFFGCFSLADAFSILANALPYWGWFFWLLPGDLVILSAVGLVTFSFAYPDPRELPKALGSVLVLGLIALASFAYDLRWIAGLSATPRALLTLDQPYLLLLPGAVLLVVSVFLYRAVQLDRRPLPKQRSCVLAQARRVVAVLRAPGNRAANTQRMFMIAMLFCLLPGCLGVALGAGLIGGAAAAGLLGSAIILGVSALFLANLFYAPEHTSFSVRLVSVPLVTLLFILSVVAIPLFEQVDLSTKGETAAMVAALRHRQLPDLSGAAQAAIGYVLEWGPADGSSQAPTPAAVYLRPDLAVGPYNTMLAAAGPVQHRVAAELLSRLETLRLPAVPVFEQAGAPSGGAVKTRTLNLIDAGQSTPVVLRPYQVRQGGRRYEVGLDENVLSGRAHQVTLLLTLVTLTGLAMIIAGHNLLLWPSLVTPLRRLLASVWQAEAGDLTVRVSITYWDEIGTLTNSFNRMLATLQEHSQHLEALVLERTTQLTAAKAQAEAANQAKSSFLANISHELRTPLTSILGYTDVLLREPGLGGSLRQDLGIIQENGERLLGLVNDLLDLAQIEAGRLLLRERAFSLQEQLASLHAMFRPALQAKDLVLKIDIAPGTPTALLVDGDKLQQILVNLVSNAIKYTDLGGVTIQAWQLPSPVGTAAMWLAIEVADTGSGIPPSAQAAIFDAFVQVPAQPGSAPGGAGLGLSISRQYARFLGGDLTAASNGVPGEGAQFRLTLPVRLYSAPASAMPPADTPATAAAPHNLQEEPAPLQLVVDDDSGNRMVLAAMLRNLGFPVAEAANGQEALAAWANGRPGLIWLDMNMPVLSGQETVQRLRGLPGGDRIPVVAVTASAFAESRAQLLALGCDGLLIKPYHQQAVLDLLAQLSGSRPAGAAAPAVPRRPALHDGAAGPATARQSADDLLSTGGVDAQTRQRLHELRNAVTTIGGLAEILVDHHAQMPQPEIDACLRELLANSARIKAGIEQLRLAGQA